jgi:hypothetical protein
MEHRKFIVELQTTQDDAIKRKYCHNREDAEAYIHEVMARCNPYYIAIYGRTYWSQSTSNNT